MKHAVAVAWLTGTIVVIALIALLGMNLTVWSGPNLTISAMGSKAKVGRSFSVSTSWASQDFGSRVMTPIHSLSMCRIRKEEFRTCLSFELGKIRLLIPRAHSHDSC